MVEASGMPALQLDPQRLKTVFQVSAPTDLNRLLGRSEQAANATVVHANVVEPRTDETAAGFWRARHQPGGSAV